MGDGEGDMAFHVVGSSVRIDERQVRTLVGRQLSPKTSLSSFLPSRPGTANPMCQMLATTRISYTDSLSVPRLGHDGLSSLRWGTRHCSFGKNGPFPGPSRGYLARARYRG